MIMNNNQIVLEKYNNLISEMERYLQLLKSLIELTDCKEDLNLSEQAQLQLLLVLSEKTNDNIIEAGKSIISIIDCSDKTIDTSSDQLIIARNSAIALHERIQIEKKKWHHNMNKIGFNI